MLSHRNSRGFSRLRSTGSSSKVLRNAKTEADLRSVSKAAYQQAVAAASLAFERVMGTSQRERNHSLTACSANDQNVLGRKKSVRFTGPNAAPIQKRSITRRQARTWENISYHEPSSPAKSRDEGSTFEEKMLFSPAHPRNSPVDSTPLSSYRRLKKSQSMFSPHSTRPGPFFRSARRGETSSRSDQMHTSGITDDSPSNSRQSKALSSAPDTAKRLHHPCPGAYEQELVIQKARDEYIRRVETQSLEPKSSTASLRTRRQSQKSFRRTVRTNSSSNSYGAAISSQAAPVPEKTRVFNIGPKTRKISNSLRDKFRRIFRKTSGSNRSLPSQHIDSQRPHFGNYMQESSTSDKAESYLPILSVHTSDPDTSQSSSIDKLHVRSGQCSHSGSNRSLRSSYSSGAARSRVTSWTNSIETDATRQLQASDIKRLSIIQENSGPTQPSSSAGMAGSRRGKGYALFGKPIQPGSSRINEPINSQRIFSALQKRLDERNRTKELGESDPVGPQKSRRFSSNISRGPSRRVSEGNRQSAPKTVRLIDDEHFDKSLLPTKAWRGSESLNFASFPTVHADDVFLPSPVPSVRHKRSNARVSVELTLQDLADHNEGITYTGKKPLVEKGSVFFPPNLSYTKEQPSPYRMAMQARTQPKEPADPGLSGLEKTTSESMDSGSLYSRDVDGSPKYPLHLDSVILKDDQRLDAKVNDNLAAMKQSIEAMNGSIVCKLDAGSAVKNPAEQESQKHTRNMGGGTGSRRATRHRREKAQIDNDDEVAGKQLGSSIRQPSGDTTLHSLRLQDYVNTGNDLSARKQSSSRSPLMEKGNLLNNSRSPNQASGRRSPALLHNRTKSLITSKHKQSPERINRLRRMQSNVVVTQSKENRSSLKSEEQLKAGEKSTFERSPDEKQPVSGSEMVELFLSSRRSAQRLDRTSSPAFI